ncbi:hypothetical protein [Aeromonas veronii]|uniref:hypothetical protein n=1 Tax=Aeromonas veronii TaxID=654 RepID=UPI003D25C760
MSNIIQFPPSRQGASSDHGDEPKTALDGMLDELTASLDMPMTGGEKQIFMKRLKGILKARCISFRASPPTGLEVPKTPHTIFIIEAKAAFTLGLKKKKAITDDWVIYPLNEVSPADAAGQVINVIGVRGNGTI